MRAWLPLIGMLILAGVLGKKLFQEAELSTFLREKEVPAMNFEVLGQPGVFYNEQELVGDVTLVNFWASWCVSCRQEQAALMQIKEEYGMRMVGINYKDNVEAASQWLQEFGDPYEVTLLDPQGRAGMEWGVIGTPEVFVIDTQGIIRYKHRGPMSLALWKEEIWPLVCQLLEKKLTHCVS